MDGFIFSSLKDSENDSSPRYRSLKRICLYNLCKYGHALLLMGIYNNYSGYYKIRRRICVSEPFDKLNLSGKNIKKSGPGKVWRLGVMLRNMT